MHYYILLLFALSFSMGIYLILAHLLKISTFRARRAILSVGRQKKKAKNSDAAIMELAVKLSPFVPMDAYKRRKLVMVLHSAGIKETPEVYLAQAYVKSGLVFFGALPCLAVIPILAPAFLIMGIGVLFSETGKAEKTVRDSREAIEYELPRFVATITQELLASRDVLSMLETYQKHAGPALKRELSVTTADMRTGSYEAALTRMESRVSSAMVSDVVRGLIGVIRGDDGVAYFQMMGHDMKQLEIQRLKTLALERPPKIRRYSFLLLACMLMIYMGVMAYQILGTMSGMF